MPLARCGWRGRFRRNLLVRRQSAPLTGVAATVRGPAGGTLKSFVEFGEPGRGRRHRGVSCVRRPGISESRMRLGVASGTGGQPGPERPDPVDAGPGWRILETWFIGLKCASRTSCAGWHFFRLVHVNGLGELCRGRATAGKARGEPGLKALFGGSLLRERLQPQALFKPGAGLVGWVRTWQVGPFLQPDCVGITQSGCFSFVNRASGGGSPRERTTG